jgi:transposase-like protein
LKKVLKTLGKYCEVEAYYDAVAEYSYHDKPCPHCNASGQLTPYGSYERHLVSYNPGVGVNDTVVTTLRFKCKSCTKTHALLPDILIPYSPYSLLFKLNVLLWYFERTMTVAAICHSFGISVPTLYAWKKQFLLHIALSFGLLASHSMPASSFIRELLDTQASPSPLQRFFNKFGFSFMQTQRKTAQSRPP